MITVIQFDKSGKPHWHKVDTGKFIHKLDDLTVRQTLEFTQADRDWFKKPIKSDEF